MVPGSWRWTGWILEPGSRPISRGGGRHFTVVSIRERRSGSHASVSVCRKVGFSPSSPPCGRLRDNRSRSSHHSGRIKRDLTHTLGRLVTRPGSGRLMLLIRKDQAMVRGAVGQWDRPSGGVPTGLRRSLRSQDPLWCVCRGGVLLHKLEVQKF